MGGMEAVLLLERKDKQLPLQHQILKLSSDVGLVLEPTVSLIFEKRNRDENSPCGDLERGRKEPWTKELRNYHKMADMAAELAGLGDEELMNMPPVRS